MSGVNAYTGKAASPGPLFDNVRPISRTNDPDTSHEAERKLRATGALNEQCRKTLHALREHFARYQQDPTTAELAKGDASLIRVYSKRLPDLREMGFVTNTSKRKCEVTKMACRTWRAS